MTHLFINLEKNVVTWGGFEQNSWGTFEHFLFSIKRLFLKNYDDFVTLYDVIIEMYIKFRLSLQLHSNQFGPRPIR